MIRPKVPVKLASLVLFIAIIFLSVKLWPNSLFAHWPFSSSLLEKFKISQIVRQKVETYIPITTPDELAKKINQYRATEGLSAFITDPVTCKATGSLENQELNQNAVFGVCPSCTHAALLTIGKYAYPNQILSSLLAEDSAAKIMNDPQLTHLCIQEKNDVLNLFLARISNTTTSTKPAPVITNVPSNPTNFSESQLWQALVDYRHAHKKPDLLLNENLCIYARKRVDDHITKMNTDAPETYPVPEKYPLDAHSGFARDAESGYAFEVTGMNALAENLAYWPNAQSANHVIEWGWDTSTEGHREAQLSVDYNHACLSGKDGFYVAIFGR